MPEPEEKYTLRPEGEKLIRQFRMTAALNGWSMRIFKRESRKCTVCGNRHWLVIEQDGNVLLCYNAIAMRTTKAEFREAFKPDFVDLKAALKDKSPYQPWPLTWEWAVLYADGTGREEGIVITRIPLEDHVEVASP